MNRRIRWASLVLLVMACVAATPQPVRQRPISDVVRLLGSWNCDGYAPGSTSVETYSRQIDGSILVSNSVHTSVGSSGIVIETFTFDPTTSTWTVSAAPNPLFDGLELTGPIWSDRKWTLTGTETVRKAPRPVRIVYTDLGPNAFRREHQAQLKGDWIDDGEFVCTRVGAAPFIFPSPGATRKAGTLRGGAASAPFSSGAARRAAVLTPTPLPAPAAVAVHSAAATTVPTVAPTRAPTRPPTPAPTVAPTRPPTPAPTIAPTRPPTPVPTVAPTRPPTPAPTVAPTRPPTHTPTAAPTRPPTPAPTVAPTRPPTPALTAAPTRPPTAAPTPATTSAPTLVPSVVPTFVPTAAAARLPVTAPTNVPSAALTPAPSAVAARAPSVAPSSVASVAAARSETANNPGAAVKTATPAKVAAVPRHVASPKPNPDYAYGLLGPAWSCETVGGIASTHTYALESDGSITMRNDLRVGTHAYLLVEHYRFDHDHARWSTSLERGGYSGTAPEWLGPKWIFNGVESTKGHDAPVRMIYTKLGAQAYRRDFQLNSGGATQTLESETCQRG